MEEFTHLHLVMTISGGVLAFLLQFATLIWRMSRVEYNIREDIHKVETDAKLELERFKLKVSDEYLRKDSFRLAFTTTENHLIRLEAKLDAVIQSRPYIAS